MHLRVFCGEPTCRAFLTDVVLEAAPTWPLRCPRCRTVGRPAPAGGALDEGERALRCEAAGGWEVLAQEWLDDPSRGPVAKGDPSLASTIRERVRRWIPQEVETPSPAPVDAAVLRAEREALLEHALAEHLPRGALDATQWAASMLLGAHLAAGATSATRSPLRLWGRLLTLGFPASAAHAIDAPEELWWAHRQWESPVSLDLWDLRPGVELTSARRPLASPEAWLTAWAAAVLGDDRRSLLALSLMGPFQGDPRLDGAWGEACLLVQDVVVAGEEPRVPPPGPRWTMTDWRRLDGAPEPQETVAALAAVALRDDALLAVALAPAFAQERDVRGTQGRPTARIVRAASWARLGRDAGMEAPVPAWLEALVARSETALRPPDQERRDVALEARRRLAASPGPVLATAPLTPLESVEEELLAAVGAAPDDDGPRLVYADHLAERDPARAEFITTQCALPMASGTRRIELARRAQTLLRAHRSAWCAPVPGLLAQVLFERGFMTHVTARARPFLEGAAGLFAREPIASLELVDTPGAVLEELARAPWRSRLERLSLAADHLEQSGAEALFAALGPLRGLHLRAPAAPWLVRLIEAGPARRSLEELHLGPAPAVAVGALGALEALRALRLEVAGPDSIRAALGEETALEALDFEPAPGASWHLEGWLKSWRRLRRLRLRGGNARPLLLTLAAGGAPKLEELSIEGEVAPLDAILAGPWEKLHTLRITGPVTGQGAGLVAALPELRALEVRDAYLSLDDLHALGRAPTGLRELAFSNAAGGVEVAATLAGGEAFEHLEALRLFPDLGDEGVEALTARRWPALERLTLEGRSITHRGLQRLAASDAFPSLVHLRVLGCGGFRRAEAALRARFGGGAELPRR